MLLFQIIALPALVTLTSMEHIKLQVLSTSYEIRPPLVSQELIRDENGPPA